MVAKSLNKRNTFPFLS